MPTQLNKTYECFSIIKDSDTIPADKRFTAKILVNSFQKYVSVVIDLVSEHILYFPPGSLGKKVVAGQITGVTKESTFGKQTFIFGELDIGKLKKYFTTSEAKTTYTATNNPWVDYSNHTYGFATDYAHYLDASSKKYYGVWNDKKVKKRKSNHPLTDMFCAERTVPTAALNTND